MTPGSRVPAMVAALALIALLAATPVASDDYPAGCVDCHVETDEADLRIDALLAVKGHGRLLEQSNSVPEGCNHCHAADNSGAASPMRTLMHMVHYEAPDENTFVLEFGSDCRHCHSMSDADGLVTIKSGDANWPDATKTE